MLIEDIISIYGDKDGRVNCFDCPLDGMQNTKCPKACTGKKEAWVAIQKHLTMSIEDYQALADRTVNRNLTPKEMRMHALHGMVGEIGEIHSLYQKVYQGHSIDEEHLKKELGDLMWFIAEFCTGYCWKLEDICRMNIDKLKARYPDGFEEERSLKRAEGDI